MLFCVTGTHTFLPSAAGLGWPFCRLSNGTVVNFRACIDFARHNICSALNPTLLCTTAPRIPFRFHSIPSADALLTLTQVVQLHCPRYRTALDLWSRPRPRPRPGRKQAWSCVVCVLPKILLLVRTLSTRLRPKAVAVHLGPLRKDARVPERPTGTTYYYHRQASA